MNKNDYAYAQLLGIMREQGGKDNPTTLELGIMQSANSLKIGDLLLEAEDLYIADHLLANYSRKLKDPYVSSISPEEKQENITFADGLKKGDIVAVQRLHATDIYVILARVVRA